MNGEHPGVGCAHGRRVVTELMHVVPKDDVMRALRELYPVLTEEQYQRALGVALNRTFIADHNYIIEGE